MSEKAASTDQTGLSGLPLARGLQGFWHRAHVQGWAIGTLFNMTAMQACYPDSKAFLLSGSITFIIGGAVAHKVEEVLIDREISLNDDMSKTQKNMKTRLYIESDLNGPEKAYPSWADEHYWRDFAGRCFKVKVRQAGALAGMCLVQSALLTGLGMPWQNAAAFAFSSAMPLGAEIVSAMARWRAVLNDKKRVLPLPEAQNG